MVTNDWVGMVNDINEYKDMLDVILEKYGTDIKTYLMDLAVSSIQVQAAAFNEAMRLGFSREEAMKLILSAKIAIVDVNKK